MRGGTSAACSGVGAARGCFEATSLGTRAWYGLPRWKESTPSFPCFARQRRSGTILQSLSEKPLREVMFLGMLQALCARLKEAVENKEIHEAWAFQKWCKIVDKNKRANQARHLDTIHYQHDAAHYEHKNHAPLVFNETIDGFKGRACSN